MHEVPVISVPVSEVTATALNSEALASTKVAANKAFDNQIEQAALSFVLSSLDSDHHVAGMMGEYERQHQREKGWMSGEQSHLIVEEASGIWRGVYWRVAICLPPLAIACATLCLYTIRNDT
jgi:hypothetical protein